MSITRRAFLYYTAPLTLAPLLPAQCGDGDYLNGETPFLHGVASGDPLSGAVVLWTRITADPAAPPEVEVRWRMATDPEFRRVVAHGTTRTSAETDHTVKVDASGLRPGVTYYYRFTALGHESPIGRTKTLPVGHVGRVRFAVASCSNYPFGFFNAYARIAARADLDAVLHLGDYLYEYANGQFGDGAALDRVPVPNRETVSLQDYRARHAQYKTDPDLQEAHRQHPFITVWDDHESANDAFEDGAENHQPLTEGSWEARKQAALQAYFEWMPIRGFRVEGSERIYRSFRFGKLIDLILLDTRLAGRDAQAADPCDTETLNDPARQLLGNEQEDWFLSELRGSSHRGARWRLIGQQVMFGQLVNVTAPGACVFNPDQWDGYPVSRARVLDALSRDSIDNVVVLTGDIHSSWAIDIAPNPFNPAEYNGATGAGSRAVEIVVPAVTSPGIADPAQAALLARVLASTHPHVKFVELNRQGYALVDVTPERVQAEWYHVGTVLERRAEESLAVTLQTFDGQNHWSEALAPSVPPSAAPPLAPAEALTS